MSLENLERFAEEHDIILETRGEISLVGECVGFLDRTGCKYIGFNPYQADTKSYRECYYDDRFFEVMPENAYVEHNCLCVLVFNEDYESALEELSDWIDALEEMGELEVLEYFNSIEGLEEIVGGEVDTVIKYK